MDKGAVLWSRQAATVVVASTDFDKAGASYSGKQRPHYIETNAECAAVQLFSSGLMGDVAWNSSCTEFCAVWGFMSAQAIVFNLKWDSVLDFRTLPQNAAYSSPSRRRLV